VQHTQSTQQSPSGEVIVHGCFVSACAHEGIALSNNGLSPKTVLVTDTTVIQCQQVYCAVLYCAVLYCAVLCCAVLYCAVLCKCAHQYQSTGSAAHHRASRRWPGASPWACTPSSRRAPSAGAACHAARVECVWLEWLVWHVWYDCVKVCYDDR
jgi:hypothetical protein